MKPNRPPGGGQPGHRARCTTASYPGGPGPSTHPTVYVAAPLGADRHPRYLRALDGIRSLIPGAHLVEGVRAFRGNGDWRRRWPEVLAGVDLVVVVPGPRGVVGAGVLAEVADAAARRVPVRVWDGDGIRPLGGAVLRFARRADPRKLARMEVR